MNLTSEPAQASAIIFAPHGRDSAVAKQLLREAQIDATICPTAVAFEEAINETTTFAIVTESALRSVDLRRIETSLQQQPAWSDFPFIVLTHHGMRENTAGLIHISERLGNVTFLERPFQPATFVSVARTALKGRQRQFESRARIEELHEGEERLRTALLAGRLGSWELDLVSGILTTTATSKALFGRAPHDPFSYDDLLAGIHPDDRERMQQTVLRTVETGADYAIEYRTVWPDGSIHWAEIHASLVRTGPSGHPRMVGVSSDITERKTSEERLRKLNESLEERVRERTLELDTALAAVLAEVEQRERAEEQLRHAQKMETIGQLTGGVAHDFNNLLTAVMGNLELLRKHLPADPKTERLFNGAMLGAQRGAALTQRLLAFARQQDLKIEPVNLADLIRGATSLIERSAGSQVEIEVDLPTDLPRVLVDANQIELAVINLVVNARDAMPNGGNLIVSVDRNTPPKEVGLPNGEFVRLRVEDNGEGMDAATLKKATDPFFSTKDLGKGTGLGLSMVHGLAVQLNGALRLTSEVGRGTVVELWLPTTTTEADTEQVAPTDAGGEPVDKITILVVDDDELIAMSMVDMLEDVGHDVIEVNSAAGALDVLREDRPIDLMITDFLMPRMNGAQLASAARRIRPNLPILLATGYAELPAKLDIHLPRIAKPYQQDQLLSEITNALKENELRHS